MAHLGAAEQRCVVQLTHFNFVLRYCPGKANVNTYAMSRRPPEAATTMATKAENAKFKEQQMDKTMRVNRLQNTPGDTE